MEYPGWNSLDQQLEDSILEIQRYSSLHAG